MTTTTHDIAAAIARGTSHVCLGGIFGAARAHTLAVLASSAPDRTVLAITPTDEDARKLHGDLASMTPPDQHNRLALFPDADVLPYLKLSPEPTLWADRLKLLFELTRGTQHIIVASITSAMRAVPPQRFVSSQARTIRRGDLLDRDELARCLVRCGYEDVGIVEDEGSFAVRGGIVDLWTPVIDRPVRIELDGDQITALRHFDPASQRSRGDLDETIIIPAGDISFTHESVAAALDALRERAADKDFPVPERRHIADMLREHMTFPGIESLAPLFHQDMTTIASYLPRDGLVLLAEPDEIMHAAEAHLDKIRDIAASSSSIETLVAPEELYTNASMLLDGMKDIQRLDMTALDIGTPTATALQTAVEPTVELRSLIAHHNKDEDALSPLLVKLDEWRSRGIRCIFACHTASQADRLIDLFRWHNIELDRHAASLDEALRATSTRHSIVITRVSEGFLWAAERIALITDEEIFGRKAPVRARRKEPIEHFSSFAELADGDVLVHEHHGIGRYAGLSHLDINGVEGDYLLLEYAGGDKLYIPVYRMNLVQRYVGSGETQPPLDRLGGSRWSRIKKSVKRAIVAMAKDLLQVQAARQLHKGYSYPAADASYEEFCAAFPFDETPDQMSSIDEVMRDMESPAPMDRLVCGDVGYGKTEVAMRAAFKASMAGKQVALLVPTTILALQHYETFTERFAETPLHIEMLSRFRSAKEQKAIVAEVQRGTVDIIIGTHRLLSRDTTFRDLGLVIVDEEQRFGVKHKEKLKRLKKTVDVLTLTATPIPRTLHLSLTGIRNISVINTPPADRLSITTHVIPFDEAIIRHAILEEIQRGGQVFFVHNRVQTMPSMLARLRRIVPEAAISMAHGQMSERELEDVMIDFLEKKTNVLLCTAIIESGLDIPSANTIIINRADTFGLAQLYQLRGRVGRSDVRAHAYLLTPQEATITPAAKKRLMVLKRFTELGSGFQIATHDLELRGGGNILGAAQSGHVAEVGYELYTKMLARAVRKLSGQKVAEEVDPEIKLDVDAFMPDGYIADAGTRIDCYRRLATCSSEEEVEGIALEIEDRFGPLPDAAQRLVGIMSLKMRAQQLKLRQLSFDGRSFALQFDPSTPFNPVIAARLAAEAPDRYRLFPPDRLIVMTDDPGNPEGILEEARKILSELLAYDSAGSHED